MCIAVNLSSLICGCFSTTSMASPWVYSGYTGLDQVSYLFFLPFTMGEMCLIYCRKLLKMQDPF